MIALTAGEAKRLRTWAITVADTLLPDTRHRDEGDERRYLGQGGLTINKKSGSWFSHSTGVGGFSTVALIEFIKKCGREKAITWAQAWLTSHVGIGTCDGDSGGDVDTATPASAAQAREILVALVDVSGTAGEAYLASRRLDAPFPATAFLPNARCGEGALVAILTSHGRTVGVQCTYLDALGQKSTVVPQRRHFMLEKVVDAVFETPFTGENPDFVVCEGHEDMLAVYRFGKRHCRIIGLPGIGTLRHLTFPSSTKVTVVRDGDAPGSRADSSLQEGIDHLILAGHEVHVTARPPIGLDANTILQEAGVDGLVTFLDGAEPAQLSLDGEIERLARLSETDYEIAREDAVKALRDRGFKVRATFLDKAVEKSSERIAKAQSADDEGDWGDVDNDPVWLTPVDGAALLGDIEKAVGRFVYMTRHQRRAVAFWVMFTHCFAAAYYAPKLWVKSPEKRCGKTRLMEVLYRLVARPIAYSYISAAALGRKINRYQPTVLLDEIDTYLATADNSRLTGLINAGFERDFSTWSVCTGDDKQDEDFSAWCPQALSGIGKLQGTNADRCIRIELERKPRNQKVESLRRKQVADLVQLKIQCTRWADDNLQALVDRIENGDEPDISDQLNDRAANAWELLFHVAALAGSPWPHRLKQAAVKISGDGVFDVNDESTGIQLLYDIRTIYDEKIAAEIEAAKKKGTRVKWAPKDYALTSANLVGALNAIEDGQWSEFSRGHPLTQNKLAKLLRQYNVSPQRIRIEGQETQLRGYYRRQFEQAFARYLPAVDGDVRDGPSFSGVESVTASQPKAESGFEADFEPSQEGACDTLKNGGDAQPATACDAVTLKTLKKGGSQHTRVSKPPNKGNGTDPSPPDDGAAAPQKRYRTLGQVVEMIRKIHRQHPEWPIKKIAKTTGQPEERVRRALDNGSSAT